MSACEKCNANEGQSYTFYVGYHVNDVNKTTYYPGSPHTFYLCDDCIKKNNESNNRISFGCSVIVMAISALLFFLIRATSDSSVFLIPGGIALICFIVFTIKGFISVLKNHQGFFSRKISDSRAKDLAKDVWVKENGKDNSSLIDFRTESEVIKMFHK